MTNEETAKFVLDGVYKILGRGVLIGLYDSLPETTQEAFATMLGQAQMAHPASALLKEIDIASITQGVVPPIAVTTLPPAPVVVFPERGD